MATCKITLENNEKAVYQAGDWIKGREKYINLFPSAIFINLLLIKELLSSTSINLRMSAV
jgi:hypothetical protein